MLATKMYGRDTSRRIVSRKTMRSSISERPRHDSQISTHRPAYAGDLHVLLGAIAGSALVIASLVLWVWIKMTQVQTGYEIHRLQQNLIELRYEHNEILVELSSLNSPERLEQIARDDFGLQHPSPTQVIHLDSLSSVSQNEANP